MSTTTPTTITPIEAVEALLISGILSGVCWSVLEGFQLVPPQWVSTGILGTTLLLASLFIVEAAWPEPTPDDRYRY
ncbi:MAG: hypothetical protein SVG88_11460 [Halobacteriales archaeon]|nr:hypothetical protein [Halobacteriales archaeon]